MLIGAACLFVAALGERLISTRCFVGGTLDIVRLSSAPCGERTLFLLVLIGFVVRIPLFPFHSWIIAISENASPAVMTLLIGLVPLTGGYGLLRVATPLFPAVAAGWWWILAGLGIVTILYSALNAIGETNLRRATAHLLVAMTGFACLGIALPTTVGANGAVMILLSQALIAPFMLSLLGNHLRHDRLWTAGMVVGWLAELSVPGFLGQIMVTLSAFQTHSVSPIAIDLVLVGICLGIALVGTAAVLCMRRSATLAAPTSPASPAAVEPVAMAALLLAIFVVPFCILLTRGALEAILRRPAG
jgi:NADH-quinone oxidoreductase subunit M